MKWRVLACAAFFFIFSFFDCAAQRMRIEGFSRVKASIVKQTKPVTDKNFALIDLSTEQKGFTFVADGRNKVSVEESDGIITLKVPHKTRYLTVKHPDFGIYTWRVPGKYLKKKCRYRATLFAMADDKEYKLGWQWVLFDISPDNVVLSVDSATYLVRDGGKTLRLATGAHTYSVEAPFYESVADTFTLTDTSKLQLKVSLQPYYSYLTVKTPWKKADIRIDGHPIGGKGAVSGRLAEGMHKLSVYVNDERYHEQTFTIGRAEKKTIEVTERTVFDKRVKKGRHKGKNKNLPGGTQASAIYAQVTLTATDDSTEIWLNREKIGAGQWTGRLQGGFYLATTRKNGVESEPLKFTVADDTPQEFSLSVPETGEGMLNIYSNVEGAEIYVNGVFAGLTPCVVKGLPSSRECSIVLRKEGCKEAKKKVCPRGNDLQDVYIKIK